MTQSGRRFTSIAPRAIWLALVAVFALIAAICFWPITTLNSPLWKVLVVDQQGKPVDGIRVTLDFQNYSAEAEGHMQLQRTDASGSVVFAPTKITVSGWGRMRQIVKSAGAGVEASFGPHATIFAQGRGLSGSATTGDYVTDWKGSPAEMSSTIILKPNK